MATEKNPTPKSPTDATLVVRPLAAPDLEGVVAIDAGFDGHHRRGYFEKRLEAALRDPAGHIQFAIEADGKLVGFLLARVLEEEFDRAGAAVDFEAIGIIPTWEGHGAGHMLLDALMQVMRHKGIDELQTQARWSNHRLLAFLDSAGFELAPRQIIRRTVSDPLPARPV